jgi:antitoxin component YwqK of YwqJK toxin-antitoxin module
MYWVDGSVYKGFWTNGVQNGLGIMYFPDGQSKAGVFQDNALAEILYDEH